MKNPWMSAWLSIANGATAPVRGQIAAEVVRQQNAMMRAWTDQATRMWVGFWFPWLPPSGERRK